MNWIIPFHNIPGRLWGDQQHGQFVAFPVAENRETGTSRGIRKILSALSKWETSKASAETAKNPHEIIKMWDISSL